MPSSNQAFSRMQRDKWISLAEWFVIAGVCVVDALLAHVSGIPMEAPAHSIEALAVIVGLWPVLAVFTRVTGFARGSDVIAQNAAKFFIFIVAASGLEYYLATNPAPLNDALMVRLDSIMGFQWPVFFDWVYARKDTIGKGLAYLYSSLHIQAALVLFVVGLLYPRRANYFITAFLISSLLTLFIFGVVPVAGPFVYFHHTDLPPAAYTEHYLHMRDHTLTAIPMDDIRGIISFPSFHVASAVVMTYFFRRVFILSWLALIVNIGMSVASLVIGGHYLTDVVAGLAVGLLTIAIVHSLYGKGPEIRLSQSPKKRRG